MKFITKSLAFDHLITGENVRLPSNLDLDTLAEDIQTNGLQNPVQVWYPSKGETAEVLRGHRRKAAIDMIRTRNPARFEELFGKGIPCTVITEITSSEALVLKVDHGNEKSLSDPFEVQLCANLLFAAGKAEKDVVASLAGLMDRISPMRGKNRKELEEIESAIKVAEAAGDKLLADIKRAAALDYTFQYRRGLVQGMHNAYRCPSIVMAALSKKAGGMVPADWTNEYLPDITQNEVKGLWKAHSEDMTILENGRPKFNQDRPGPAFRTAWDKLIQKSKADEASAGTAVTRPKSMSANDIMADVKEGKFKSEIACKLALYHAGDRSIAEELPGLDSDAYAADLVRTHDATLWNMVKEEAAKIAAKIREADKATTVAPTASA